MNNTPPKYNTEEINWKKYLDDQLQEQIKTTDAIKNLPTEFSFSFSNMADKIVESNKEIYQSIQNSLDSSMMRYMDKMDRESAFEPTIETEDETEDESNDEPDPINKMIVKGLFKMTAAILRAFDSVEESNHEIVEEYKQSSRNLVHKFLDSSKFMIENVKEGYQELSGIVAGQIRDVVGPSIQKAYEDAKTATLAMSHFLKKTWLYFKPKEKNKSEEEMYDDISTLTHAATTKGSIYTHDVAAESILKENNEYFKREEKRRLREISKDKKGTGFLAKLLFWGMIIFGMFEEEIKFTFKLFRNMFKKTYKIFTGPLKKIITLFGRTTKLFFKGVDKLFFKGKLFKAMDDLVNTIINMKFNISKWFKSSIFYKPFSIFGKIMSKFKSFLLNVGENIKKIVNVFDKTIDAIESFFKGMVRLIKVVPAVNKYVTKFEEFWVKVGKFWEAIQNSKIFRFFRWIKDSLTFGFSTSEMKKFPGLIGSISKGLNAIFESSSLLIKVKKLLGIAGRFFVRLKIIPYFIGKFIGKFLTPLEIGIRMIIGWMTGEDLVDKVMNAVSGFFYTFTSIPEMIGNALLWVIRKFFKADFLEGFDFSQIFGQQAIEDALRWLSKWISGVVDPLVKFFGKTLPDLFEKIKNWMIYKIDKIKFYLNPFNWGKSYDKERQGTRYDPKTGALLKNAGESRESWQKRVKEFRKNLRSTNKYRTGGFMATQKEETEIIKNAYDKKQKELKEQQQIQKEILKTNKELAEQNKSVSQNFINTTNMISQRGQDTKEIPNQNENAVLSLVATGALM